ncbi:hypothetical protein [Pontibacter sp. SGAir0037]|uniref:hypothetical protein n=1 Tax=Pontibacter sp. SGAir0037 TaxID=2571030 RepID=UPI0010CD1D54|nr:hypothetical protein [Pontibacter sp. SGAir0037]QCR24602.1 hypothetical protein C1N53_21070 [Pontibacter sp. SGAir0037]
MGKRQHRIFREQISGRTEELLHQKSVQLIYRNKMVLQGQIVKLGSVQLELVDGRNHKHMVPLQQVEEIIYDKEAAF